MIFRLGYQTGLYGIVLDVSSDPLELAFLFGSELDAPGTFAGGDDRSAPFLRFVAQSAKSRDPVRVHVRGLPDWHARRTTRARWVRCRSMWWPVGARREWPGRQGGLRAANVSLGVAWPVRGALCVDPRGSGTERELCPRYRPEALKVSGGVTYRHNADHAKHGPTFCSRK
jgi:hypothetical protein